MSKAHKKCHVKKGDCTKSFCKPASNEDAGKCTHQKTDACAPKKDCCGPSCK